MEHQQHGCARSSRTSLGDAGLGLGGDDPRRGAESDPDPFFVPIDEFGVHGSEHVISRARVDETKQTSGHTHTEEKVDRIVEVAAASEDDCGGVRVASHVVEAGVAHQCRDLVGFA